MSTVPSRIAILAAALLAASLLAAPASASIMPQAPNVQVIYASCPDQSKPSEGCAYPDGRIYVTPESWPGTLEHELGHAFDRQVLSDANRRWLTRAFHYRGSWRGENTEDRDGEPVSAPSEVFADEYAACALNVRHQDLNWGGGSGFEPSVKQRHRVCAAIQRVGQRRLRESTRPERVPDPVKVGVQ